VLVRRVVGCFFEGCGDCCYWTERYGSMALFWIIGKRKGFWYVNGLLSCLHDMKLWVKGQSRYWVVVC
jgi:hypothetical protein